VETRHVERLARSVVLSLLCLAWMMPRVGAHAAEPSAEGARCTQADYKRSRQAFQKLFDASRYAEAIATLQRAKETCWEGLPPQDRGWLVSDLGLAHLRAGHPDTCLQVLNEAPPGLEPSSKVAKAIAFNRGRCEGGTSTPIQVLPGFDTISKPGEAASALSRKWSHPYKILEGELPQRKKRALRRCTDLQGVGMNDVDVITRLESESLEVQFLQCRVLKALSTARPSRTSHVREVLTMKAPGEILPAAMAPTFGEDDPRTAQAQRPELSWLASEPELQFEPMSGKYNTFSLHLTGRETRGLLEWWATGDFNGDGQEDVLAYRAMSPQGGSMTDIAVFVMTRSQPQGVLQILEHWK
jgi:hypothetical protein